VVEKFVAGIGASARTLECRLRYGGAGQPGDGALVRARSSGRPHRQRRRGPARAGGRAVGISGIISISTIVSVSAGRDCAGGAGFHSHSTGSAHAGTRCPVNTGAGARNEVARVVAGSPSRASG
jgi:hypothetical protein